MSCGCKPGKMCKYATLYYSRLEAWDIVLMFLDEDWSYDLVEDLNKWWEKHLNHRRIYLGE